MALKQIGQRFGLAANAVAQRDHEHPAVAQVANHRVDEVRFGKRFGPLGNKAIQARRGHSLTFEAGALESLVRQPHQPGNVVERLGHDLAPGLRVLPQLRLHQHEFASSSHIQVVDVAMGTRHLARDRNKFSERRLDVANRQELGMIEGQRLQPGFIELTCRHAELLQAQAACRSDQYRGSRGLCHRKVGGADHG